MENKTLLDELKKERSEIVTQLQKLEAEKEALDDKVAKFQSKVDAIDTMISVYTNTASVTTQRTYGRYYTSSYPVQATWVSKILFALEYTKTPKSISDIEDFLKDNESYPDDVNYKTVSQTLWQLKKANRIKHEDGKYSLAPLTY